MRGGDVFPPKRGWLRWREGREGRTCLMCSVMPEVLASDWKKCSTISVWKVPILSAGISKSQLRCGLPERSFPREARAARGSARSVGRGPGRRGALTMTTWTRASSRGAEKSPKRWIPARVPRARRGTAQRRARYLQWCGGRQSRCHPPPSPPRRRGHMTRFAGGWFRPSGEVSQARQVSK